MSVDTIYTIAGGAWFKDTLNGVATFFNISAGDSLMAMATVISVAVAAVAYIRTRNLLELVKWVGCYVLVASVLIGAKRDVQVIDLSEPSAIYQVDNVPAGLAVLASLITRVGAGMAQVYDMIFARPDALSYSKTGMMFGAQLAATATQFRFTEPDMQRMFSDYVHNCVVGDIMLNNKYSFSDLMTTAEPYALIFSRPSPLRGLFDKQRNFLTCEQAATRLNTDSADINGSNPTPFYRQALRALHGFTNQVFGSSNGNPTVLFTEMLGDSYSYFHGSALTSTDIIRRNVVMNGLRNGLESFSASNGDTAGMVNIATQTSLAKMRLSQATSASIATHTLPVMHSVLLGMTLALLPILIVMAMLSSLSFIILKGYAYTIGYLQMWPILFSILNHAMNFYLQGKLGGTPVTLATFDQVQNTYSDIGTTAGWLALSIPFIAWGMVKGLGQVVSQAGNYLGQTMQSASTQSSSSAVDGNWTFGNMQTDNVQGFKWDTNYSHREGHMTNQLESGASNTLTASGQRVLNTMEAISRLPVQINSASTLTSSYTEQARESEQRARSAMEGYQTGKASGWSQLQQFASQRGNSDALTNGSDHSTGSNDHSGINKMLSAVEQHARANNISESESFNSLMDKSSRGTISVGGKGAVEFPRVLKVVKPEVHAGVEFNGSSGSSHSTAETNTKHTDNRFDKNAQYAQDFKEGLDMVTNSRISAGGSHTDVASSNRVSQLAATLTDTQNSYQQYSDSMTRSREYSQMAAYVQSNSAQINSNYDQQFAEYAMKKSGDAETLLTNTSSPEVAAERDRLAQTFVQERVQPQVEAQYHGHQNNLVSGISAAPAMPAAGNVENHFRENSEVIKNHEKRSGIRQDIPEGVEKQYVETTEQLLADSREIQDGKAEVEHELAVNKQAHQAAESLHGKGMAREKVRQSVKDISTYIPDVLLRAYPKRNCRIMSHSNF